jgi:hypothetical protein
MLIKILADNYVNTSDAYSDIIFFGTNNIAIPYINIGLMPDNPITQKQSVIDYSYYVLTGLKSLKFQGTAGNLDIAFSVLNGKNVIKEYLMVGGLNGNIGAEIEIECENRFFYLTNYSTKRDYPDLFVPLDTPNYRCNMNLERVKYFFSLSELPKEICEILGENIFILKWY